MITKVDIQELLDGLDLNEAMTHKLYPFVVDLWPDTNEFLLRYNSGLFEFKSAKCGSFTNDDHFNRLFREMRFMVMNIRECKEIYQQRLADRKAKKCKQHQDR